MYVRYDITIHKGEMCGCTVYNGWPVTTHGSRFQARKQNGKGNARLLGSSEECASAVVARGSRQRSNCIRDAHAGGQVEVQPYVLSGAGLQQSPRLGSRLRGGRAHI